MEVTPIELLLRANNGDKTAYERLLGWLNDHCHVQLKKGLSRYYNFPREAFDDITQDVLITFHTTHQTFETSRPLLPWINTIIRHKMIDFIRRKDFVVIMTGTDIETLRDSWIIDDELAHADNSDLLKLIEELPPQQYEILKLAKIEGYSSKEIAAQLKLTDANVKVLLHRAVKKLKQLASDLNKQQSRPE